MTDRALPPPSFWLADLDERLEPRASLDGDESVDVAIAGAGYTGLWTAYYLATQNPELRIAIVEGKVAGFGASGRNGGWCTSHHAGIAAWMAGRKRERAIAMQAAMFDAVDEVGRVAAAEAIDCDYVKSGYLTVATTDAGRERLQRMLAELHSGGWTELDYRWLDARACDARVRFEGGRGGAYSPHSAVVQPAKLARGLARAVERRGVTIYEQSVARSLSVDAIVTDRGRLRAPVVLCCTEGYTRTLAGRERQLVPLHSMMIVTEPLPESVWKTIGAEDRVLFGDTHRMLTYAQRTAGGRLAIGSAGPYLYGSGIRDYFEPDAPEFAAAHDALSRNFPALRDVEITHRWGGAMGVPRDSKPFVRFDPQSGAGSSGGYFGQGVAASNLGGRTLADLVLGRETERTTYPWVQHRSPRDWEPEPFRWLAVNGVLKMGAAIDRREARGRPARWRAALFDSASGH